MKSLFLSLNTILEAKDLYRIYIMSFLLVLVCALEVVGLVLISFLIVNLGSMDSSLLEMGFISKLNASLKISEDFSQIIFPVMIIIYAIISSIIVFHILKYVTIAKSLVANQSNIILPSIFLYFNYREVLESQNSENFSRILNDGSELGFLIQVVLDLHKQGLTNVGVVLQGRLFRTLDDINFLETAFNNIFIFYYFKSTVVVFLYYFLMLKIKLIN